MSGNIMVGGLLSIVFAIWLGFGFAKEDAKWSALQKDGVRLTMQVTDRHWLKHSTRRCRDCRDYYLVLRTQPPWSPVRARFPRNEAASSGPPDRPGFETIPVSSSVYDSSWAGQPLAVVVDPGDASKIYLLSEVDEGMTPLWGWLWVAGCAVGGVLALFWPILSVVASVWLPRRPPVSPPRRRREPY
jgi:hypothetical protein